jgi:catechol 2,3-dioxygenase-like lactoylglutathione lyase family enzyme
MDMIFRAITPQLPVRDVAASQAWYRDVLGLEVGFTRADFGSVRDGPLEIYLARAAAPVQPAWVCVRVEDADGLAAIYRERGATIVEPVATKPWGVREFTLCDPDGHRFRIGHSTRR